jgi:hypothetical protein
MASDENSQSSEEAREVVSDNTKNRLADPFDYSSLTMRSALTRFKFRGLSVFPMVFPRSSHESSPSAGPCLGLIES